MANLRKLKQEALDSAAKGNWRKAAACYADLEKNEPRDPGWALKLGESLRRLGNDAEAVKAFGRAASGYAKNDLLLKAIAVCKIILGIDPRHTQTQDMLAALYASQKQPAAPEVSPFLRTAPPPSAAPASPALVDTRVADASRSPLSRTLPASTHSAAVPGAVREPAASSGPNASPARPPTVVPAPASGSLRQPAPAAAASTAGSPGPPPIVVEIARPAPSSPAQAVAAPAAPPPLRQLRLAALVPGARQSQTVPSSGSSAAMEIPIDEEFASAPRPATRPHKGAGRRTMATFVLPKTPFFSVLTAPLLRMAIERVRLIQLAAGEVLFSQGDPGDDLFVVAWGEVAVLVPREVARLSEGDFFGEIALLADQPRTATVRATVDSQVLALDRTLIGDLVAASPDLLLVLLRFLRERLIATLAETSSLFAPFTALERLALAARFQFLEVDEGLRIVEQGAKSSGLFILLAGEAQAVAGDQVSARLVPGAVFGEISLITGQPAAASVTATCKSFLLFMPRSDFTEVIMTHPQVLEYLSTLVESRARAIGRLEIL